jgi:pyrimidine operon attenuation protein/uracil phosphoribosyltransferase
MVGEKTLILDERQVQQKIKRMAFEIYEHNFNEKNIVIAGIDGQGYILAMLLAKQVQQISPLEVMLVKVSLDKLAPQQSKVSLDCDL